MALSQDEKQLYVTNGLSDDMTLVDTQAGKAIRTVAAGRVPHTPLVSP
jgi:YVTN family beta-propeller protein